MTTSGYYGVAMDYTNGKQVWKEVYAHSESDAQQRILNRLPNPCDVCFMDSFLLIDQEELEELYVRSVSPPEAYECDELPF
jgi:hypothetical protein